MFNPDVVLRYLWLVLPKIPVQFGIEYGWACLRWYQSKMRFGYSDNTTDTHSVGIFSQVKETWERTFIF